MRRHRGNFWVLILTFILIAFGMIMIYIIGPLRAQQLGEENESAYFIGQIKAAVVSVIMFLLTWKVCSKRIEILQKIPKIVMIISLVLCVVLWVGGMAHVGFVRCQLGACRWFNVGISFQPAEVVKLGIVLLSAQYFAKVRKEGKYREGRKSGVKVAAEMFAKYNAQDALKRVWLMVKQPILEYWIYVVAALFFVVVTQKDMGSAVPIAAIVFGSMFVSGMPVKRFVAITGVIVAVFMLTIVTSPHRMERVMTLFGAQSSTQVDGEESDNKDYHARNALIAIGSGGVTGVGVGNSVQAAGYLPESINDSIFAAIGEMFGMVGLVILLGLFFGLFINILAVGDLSVGLQNKLIVDGIFMWLLSQVLANAASMIGLIPLTGVTLPLISYGGSSMLVVAIALGVVMALSEYTGRHEITEAERDGEVVSPIFSTTRRRRL